LLAEGDSTQASEYLEAGIAMCNRILETSPNDYSAKFYQGLETLALGDGAAAKEAYMRALNICSADGVRHEYYQDLLLLEQATGRNDDLGAIESILQPTA
jgi:tetratricopeptide (TPR) repeat protein